MIFKDLKNIKIRSSFVKFWTSIKDDLPSGADKTIVMRKLQEAYFYSCMSTTDNDRKVGIGVDIDENFGNK